MVHCPRLFTATLVTGLLFCHSLAAQSELSELAELTETPETSEQPEKPNQEKQPKKRSPWIFSGTTYGVHQDEADMTDSGGSFSVDRWFVNAGVTFAWSRRDMVGVTVGGGKDLYDFDGLGSFGGGNPWGDVSDARISVVSRTGFGESSVLTIIPTVRINKENGADTGDSTTYGLFAAYTWRISKSLTVGPGFGVFTKLDDGTKFFPVLAIDWNINDRWNLSTGSGVGSSQGTGLTLAYKLNQDWSFALSGRYENLEFRLNEKGVAPGGLGHDQSFPLVASVNLKPNKLFNVSLFAGMNWFGQLKIEDPDGRKLQETDYDPALLVGVQFEGRF